MSAGLPSVPLGIALRTMQRQAPSSLTAPRRRRVGVSMCARVLARPLWTLGIVVALAFTVPGVAFAQGVDALRRDADSARSMYETVLAEFEGARSRFDAQTAAIDRLKVEMEGPFDVFELRGALRDAQAAADVLAEIDGRLRARLATAEEARERWEGAVRAEIAALEAQIATASSLERAAILDRLNGLSRSLATEDSALPVFEPVPLDAILDIPDTPEEMFAAADELSDHASRLERDLEELRQLLVDAAAQQRLEERSWEFAVEEDFFGDGSGRRFAPRGSSGGSGVQAAGDGSSAAPREASDQAANSPVDQNPGTPEIAAGEAPEPAAGRSSDDRASPPPSASPGGAGAFEAAADAPDDGGDADSLGFGEEPTGVLSSIDAEPLAPTAELVEIEPSGDGQAGDQTLLRFEDGAERPALRPGRMRSRVGELRSAEQRLVEELEALRVERDRLLRQAAALESIE